VNAFAKTLLEEARRGGYAIGAFNVYNLEGALAVVAAAVTERSPVMLQLHPAALNYGGESLIALCLTAAREANVPVAVHLDHSTKPMQIRAALAAGIKSVMADGSPLSLTENATFTREMAVLAHDAGACIEAELGRLSGMEDGVTVTEQQAKMTDPAQAQEFVQETGVDALAVCVGNIHGTYAHEPRLDFDRLAAIQKRVALPLVLHGASGLPASAVRGAIELGVAKFNVNTEIRGAYIDALREQLQSPKKPDVLDVMKSALEAMKDVVVEKIRLFGSSGKVLLEVPGSIILEEVP
jgi:tagatose 1,6-diphosphate aldolase GatY/KbaY